MAKRGEERGAGERGLTREDNRNRVLCLVVRATHSVLPPCFPSLPCNHRFGGKNGRRGAHAVSCLSETRRMGQVKVQLVKGETLRVCGHALTCLHKPYVSRV